MTAADGRRERIARASERFTPEEVLRARRVSWALAGLVIVAVGAAILLVFVLLLLGLVLLLEGVLPR